MKDEDPKQIDLDQSEWTDGGEPEYRYEWEREWKKKPGEQPPFHGYITDWYDAIAAVIVICGLIWYFQ